MLFMRSKFLLALPLLAASLLAMPALPASAQSGGNTPVNVRGTIDKLSGDVLTVNSREGQKVPIKINSDVQISSVLKRSLADIKPGDYIASTSMRGTDGKLHALEIHIFPPGRKPGEGQRPYDLAPNSLMTNASVAEVANVTQGKVFTVTYKGSKDDVVVGPEVPVVTYGPGDKSLLKPGATVFIAAQKQPDGSMVTSRITAEKDGVKPPM
jgi:hypothetical protein